MAVELHIVGEAPSPDPEDRVDEGIVIELAAHRRASRWAQIERPAVTIPTRIRGSRYGVHSPFVPTWAVNAESSAA